ncbi:MAG: hypothetical protein KGJ78_14215 [Alphaproteobacteria bacterium]|nr:hypothetical protein [Alphaproteobacteria bacterium]
MSAPTEAEIAREGRRILRKLLSGGRILRGTDGGTCLVGRGRSRRIRLEPALVAALVKRGWIAEEAGGFAVTAAGTAFLARAGGDACAVQHQVLRTRLVRDADGREHHVVCNVAESPLAWLRHRGQISALECEAGEKLRRDFTIGRLSPRLGVDWSMPLAGRHLPRSQALLPDTVLAAKQRFAQAMRAIGPGLAELLFDVCCDLRGLEACERVRGWPRASAKVVLRLALGRLAAHYGMTARSRARMRSWSLQDGEQDGGGRGRPPPDQNGRQNLDM